MPALQVRPHRFGSGGFCWRVGTHNRWLTQQAPLQRLAAQGQCMDCQLHLGGHVVTQNKSLSQKVPRQRVATLSQAAQGQCVDCQLHPEESVGLC